MRETNTKNSVLIDCERLKYPKCGIATVVRNLVKGLEILNPHLEITLFGPKDLSFESDCKRKYLKFWSRWNGESSDFKIIHVSHQLSAYFHKIQPSQKKIVTVHDLNFLHENLPKNKVEKRRKLVQKNVGNASTLVFISEFAKKDFVENQHLFKLRDDVKFKVIHNGLRFPEDKIFTSDKCDFLKNKKFILNIGVLFPKKNQLVLLDFLAKTNLDLVLVSASSKSDYREKFLSKIKELDLENRVHILTDVSENDKNFLLQNCESYAHPSLAEGFGIPPIEAMYFGKPVFLSDQTSLPEIGGDLAFFFDDFSPEKMLEVYKNGMKVFNSDSKSYSNKLRLHALNFDYKKMANSYAKVYEELL